MIEDGAGGAGLAYESRHASPLVLAKHKISGS